MDLSEFAANYEHLGDDELLCLWADQNTLVPEAVAALDSELQRRGLNKQNATLVKKRFDALAARDAKGPLARQVAAARYESNMRHFVGSEEPKFYSPYPYRDLRYTFASIRHKYRVWQAFRDHTGHWPVFSIWFHFLSWFAVLGLTVGAFVLAGQRKRESSWIMFVVPACVLVLLGARQLGVRLMRKLDWKRYGT